MIGRSWARVNGFESRGHGTASRSCGSAARARARARIFALEPRGDLGGRALRLARLRAEPPSPARTAGTTRSLTRDLGWVTDVWARWDSVWFLRIAEHGYGAAQHGVAAAFYPLYPLTLAGVGRAFGGHYVLAGIVVSLAATLGSFVLLHRLAEERLGADGARRAVLYLAVFPMSLFLQAVYSESLFLALVARGASCSPSAAAGSAPGAVTGLAVLTRISGVALLPALAVIAWRRPPASDAARSRASASRRSIFAAYPLYLGLARGRRASRSPARRASGTATSRMPGRSAGSGTGSRAGVGGRPAARLRLAHALLLVTGPGRRPDARRRGQPRGASRSSSCSSG